MGEGRKSTEISHDLFGERFTNVQRIDRGGMGTVFRAVDSHLGRSVVLKVLDALHLEFPATATDEARAQAAVCWHGNVLTVLGDGTTTTGWPFLLLEDAGGGALSDHVRESGPLDAAGARALARQLAGALAATHAEGLVHSDVKPSNVLLARDGSVRLSDFGTASTSATHTVDVLQGSLLFAPPELLEGRRPAPPNDVYGLGVTLYFALTGSVPFGDVGQPAVSTIARVHSEELGFDGLGLPAWFAELLAACVSKDPAARPTIDEVCAELDCRAPEGLSSNPRVDLSSDVATVAAKSVAERRRVVERLLDTLAEDHGAVELADLLLHDLARDSAAAVMPLLELASRRCPDLGGRRLRVDQVQELVTAQLLARMSGGRELLYQGMGDYEEFEQPVAPAALRRAVADYGTSIAWARTLAPEVNWDMGPRYAERIWILLGRLGSAEFRQEFFDDPASIDLLDPETLSLMLMVAMPFFEVIITEHWEWLFVLMERRPDIRRMLAYEYPAMLLEALSLQHDRIEEYRGSEWVSELQIGFLRLATWERADLRRRFAAELAALDIEL